MSGQAAGTSTQRNPCYLLTKLRSPGNPVDTRLLPVIPLGNNAGLRLYYHYRQYALPDEAAGSVLAFLDTDLSLRESSFRAINAFAGCITFDTEPWLPERAGRVTERVVRPLVESDAGLRSDVRDVEFVEVGAGTGALTAAVSRQVRNSLRSGAKIRSWLVDLDAADPVRFFRHARLRATVDFVGFVAADYQHWLSMPRPLPRSQGLRIALVSRLFNNLSVFSIDAFDEDAVGNLFRVNSFTRCMPDECLRPTGDGASLLNMLGPKRDSLDQRRVYGTLSLGAYYRWVYIMLRPDRLWPTGSQDALLPTRAFNPECLLTSDGRSVIGRLFDTCMHIFIEDADVTEQDLLNHIREHGLLAVETQEVTRTLGLAGNRAFLLSQEKAS